MLYKSTILMDLFVNKSSGLEPPISLFLKSAIYSFVMITRNHKYRNAGTGTKYSISKNSVQNIKHSLIELCILKKQHAEETFTYNFLVSFCVPPAYGY